MKKDGERERNDNKSTENVIGDKGARAIGDMLKKNTTLVSLFLTGVEEKQKKKRERNDI